MSVERHVLALSSLAPVVAGAPGSLLCEPEAAQVGASPTNAGRCSNDSTTRVLPTLRANPSPTDPGVIARDQSGTSLKTMATPSDRELVDRARSGDAAAFDALVRRHHGRIHRLAVHMLRSTSEAEDVAQETFIRAYQALSRFDGRSEPYTWFYRIAVNLSLNVLRSRRTQRARVDIDDPRLGLEGQLTETRPSALANPPAQAERKELYVALCEAIDGLSETLRTTLILVAIDGRSHDEASTILGAPPGTIAWRVHEARRKLKAALTERGFELELDGEDVA